MRGRFPILTLVAVFATSCGDLMKVRTIRPKAAKTSKFVEGDDGGGLGGMGGVAGAGYVAPEEGVQVGKTPEEAGYLPTKVEKGTIVAGMELPSDDDIAWPISDDANSKIGFDKPFEKPKQKKSVWMRSYQEAQRESMRTGKPILMFFTSSKNSSSSSAINGELFAAHDFGNWAKENVVRLKVDIDGGVSAHDIRGDGVLRRRYAEKLKKQFHVLGYPTLVVIQPDGSVYTRERGYQRGQKSEVWGKLKNATLTIEHNYEIWKRGMELKGYREWKGTNGQVVFAKLARYYQGDLVLIEPDGKRLKTSTRGLSKEDRAWIIAEKEKREKK